MDFVCIPTETKDILLDALTNRSFAIYHEIGKRTTFTESNKSYLEDLTRRWEDLRDLTAVVKELKVCCQSNSKE